MSSDDVLTQAAQRAQDDECGAECGTFADGSIACCVGPRGHRVDGSGIGRWHSPLAADFMPVSAPDRAAVISELAAAILRHRDPNNNDHGEPHMVAGEAAGYADALISAGLVRTPGPVPDREQLGQKVRRVWIAWASEQPAPKASWLVPWEGLSEPDREVDRRIGEELAAIGAASVRTPVTTEQIERAAQALHDDPTSNTKGWLHLARCAAKALGLPVMEGGDRG